MLVEQGTRPCVTCGKPHALRRDETDVGAFGSWADPDDGHTYRPESWESIALRLMERQAHAEPDYRKPVT